VLETISAHVSYLPLFRSSFNNNYKNTRMTELYPKLSAVKNRILLLLLASFAFAFNAARAQTYYATLNGASEVPANNSAGTGKAVVTISGNLMRVQVSFSGLTGNTTASHIHAPTATASVGTAGVATTTPTFTDFPLGVKAGTYDHTFDMTVATSYNPTYITANGGTAASAFTVLKASIAAGKSYLNIHSSFAPGGEIRGFLVACPSIMVSIPDAYSLSKGIVANTVYPGYAPAASLTLQANVSGGAAPYTYSWSNGVMTASNSVSPGATTIYTAMVTDQNGCSGSSSKTVMVVNVGGGQNGKQVTVCHKGNTIAVAAPAISAHLDHGDMLGACDAAGQTGTGRDMDAMQMAAGLQVKVLANPSPNYFDIQLIGTEASNMQLRVYDLQGRLLETKPSLRANQSLRIGATYQPGVYLVQITVGNEMRTIRLIKTH
jgi:hypothetical protein